MKKYFILFLAFLLLIISQYAFAKTGLIGATGLTGGGTGALDAVECEDILGDNTDRAIATGDIAFVITSGKDFYIYRYNATGTDTEADFGPNDPIVPDDQVADCASAGQWELMDSVNVARTSNPKMIFRDLDATDNDDNVYWSIECTDTGSGTEDCDATLYVQIAGTATAVLQADADGNMEIAQDLDLATGKLFKINNTQISSANLSDVDSIAMLDEAETIVGNWVNTTNPWAVNEGGTGAATLTDGGVLLGSGTGAITAMSVLGDGEMIVGDGTTDPVAESGATLRTSIGVGTGDSPNFTAVSTGADPADTGAIRLSNNTFVYGEGLADADVQLIGADTIGRIQIGDGTKAIIIDSDSSITFSGSGTVTATAGVFSAGTIQANVLDTSGAADIDIGSGDVTDVTITTDGGSVVIDGATIQVPDATTLRTVTDADSFVIAANGEVTFSQEIQASAGLDATGQTVIASAFTGTASLATTVTVSDDESTDDAQEIVFTTDNTNLESDGDLTYNPTSGTLATTILAATGAVSGTTGTFSGTLTGLVNVSATPGSVTNFNGTYVVTAAADIDLTLPSAAAGYSVCIRQGQGRTDAITVTAASGDYLVKDGVRGTVEAGGGESTLTSGGVATDKACFVAVTADDWYMDYTGTWSE